MNNVQTLNDATVLEHYKLCSLHAKRLYSEFSAGWLALPNLNLCGVSPRSVLLYAGGYQVVQDLLACIERRSTVSGHTGYYNKATAHAIHKDPEVLAAFLLVYDTLREPCLGVPDIETLHTIAVKSVKYSNRRFNKQFL